MPDPWEQSSTANTPSPVLEKLREAALAFETEHGAADGVRDGAFVNEVYQPVWKHQCSLHPTWSYQQHQKWMLDPEEWAKLTVQEMRDCLRSDAAFIHTDPEWREDAMKAWTNRGGDPAVYRELFGAVDKHPQ